MINDGTIIAAIGLIISMAGVHAFNYRNQPFTAKLFWMVSNPLFLVYFIGRMLGYWDGVISDGIFVINYLVMTLYNIKGLYNDIYNTVWWGICDHCHYFVSKYNRCCFIGCGLSLSDRLGLIYWGKCRFFRNVEKERAP